MKPIKNMTIGISTYGGVPRSHNLIDTILKNLSDKPKDVNVGITLCDDGTDPRNLGERRSYCQRKGVRLIEHGTNRGIPQVWNTIVQQSPDADAIIIFSDGVRMLSSGWLSSLIYFLEHNEQVGSVGLPTVSHPSEFNVDDSRWDGTPGRVGAAVGCSFAFRPEICQLVKNVDGSTGFWASLRSFHEEISWGFELSKLGYLSYMLPWPPGFYRGGMAFATHQELIWMNADPYLPGDEFLTWAKQSKWHVSDYEQYYEKGRFDRMSYSRIMFCKKWGVLDECLAGRRYQDIKSEVGVDILSEPQKYVHPLVVDIWPGREIYWKARNGEEKSFVDA